MKYILLTFLLATSYAMAEETKVVYIEDDRYTWNITVENCEIDPTKPVKVLNKRDQFPTTKIVVRQNGRVQRCDVKRINVSVA